MSRYGYHSHSHEEFLEDFVLRSTYGPLGTGTSTSKEIKEFEERIRLARLAERNRLQGENPGPVSSNEK